MNDYKYRIIKQYLQKNFDISTERQNQLLEFVIPLCTEQKAIKYEQLESPGPAEQGRVWFSAEAMIHSYYHNKKKGINCGTQVWKKNEVILFTSSLLSGEERSNYIQMLEPGLVLSMSYPDALTVREVFPEVAAHIEQLIIQNDQAYQDRIRLLHEPSQERVRKFEAENRLFCTIASTVTKAMHVGLSRQGYTRIKANL
ncbi:hypothetical protein [Sphingobacterium anhuiense]|uniref:hypothetical protein n=1 Tax=Sphingobacterium anhuiense TaxID=493780 RepID=UPI003C2EFC7E